MVRIDFSNLLSSTVPKIAESIKLPLLKKVLSNLLPVFCGKNALNCKMLLPRLLIPRLPVPKLLIPRLLMPSILLLIIEEFGPRAELGPKLGPPIPEVLSLIGEVLVEVESVGRVEVVERGGLEVGRLEAVERGVERFEVVEREGLEVGRLEVERVALEAEGAVGGSRN